ncbi:MAG: hypothetical protein MZV63_41485 [Marinilabiliales bacterium]|nr:hypothetical protein [Marinilabiliales bacterium]
MTGAKCRRRSSSSLRSRTRYLSEIAETVRNYNSWAEKQAEVAQRLAGHSDETVEMLRAKEHTSRTGVTEGLTAGTIKRLKTELDGKTKFDPRDLAR